jgi:dTDP-4-amino-4,6-dideoxygalactose transaminase
VGVPLLDLKPQYVALASEFDAALTAVIESQHFINGPVVAAFEREAAAFIGSKHAIGVASGTDALLLALWALQIGPGDEVITTPFTFFATAGAVARLGATPVFVDIEPGTFNIDCDAVEAAITERTKAVIPVHLFGVPCDMERLNALGAAHGLAIIEDAAQSMGSTWRGRQTGSIGTFGCFSFFPSKNLGCWGDGGLVTTDDDELAALVRKLKAHGSFPKYHHGIVGANSRLDAIQAAVLRVKLPHLADWAAARHTVMKRYQALIERAGLAEQVRFQQWPDDTVPAFHQMVVRVPRRDELLAHLEAAGIGTAVYYPKCLHQQECFADLGYAQGSLPVAELAQTEVLALPVFPELSEAQQAEVVDVLRSFFHA